MRIFGKIGKKKNGVGSAASESSPTSSTPKKSKAAKSRSKKSGRGGFSLNIDDIALPVFVSKTTVRQQPTRYPKENLYPSKYLDGYYFVKGQKNKFYALQEIAGSLNKAGERGYLIVISRSRGGKKSGKIVAKGVNISHPEEKIFLFDKNVEITDGGSSLPVLLKTIAVNFGDGVKVLSDLKDDELAHILEGVPFERFDVRTRKVARALKRVSFIEREQSRMMRAVMILLLLGGGAFGGYQYGTKMVEDETARLKEIAMSLKRKNVVLQDQITATDKEYNLIKEIQENKKVLK